MRRLMVAVGVLGAGAAAFADPITIDFWEASGEWGVFADDGVGGTSFPDQGIFSLLPGLVVESWEQQDGISLAQSQIAGDLTVQADAFGASFIGDLDLGVLASVDGDGPGDNELAIANVGLSRVNFNVDIAEPVVLTLEGRSVTENFTGLGELGEGEHNLVPGTYWFDVAGPGLFLDASAGANQTVQEAGSFDWSMRFEVVPSPSVLGVFGVAGLACCRRRR